MRFLFYFVHPAKFHLFRYTINKLKERHIVDIIINSKDVLEDLIKNEGWDYKNIFPKGRNVSKKPSIIKSGIKFIITIVRLEKYLRHRDKYDVFVTDDALVVNGWLRGIPSYLFNDNDIKTIKINKILFYFCTNIISPATTNLGKFNKKKISFRGNKAVAHLHPKYFTPSEVIINKYGFVKYNYVILRISKLNATHDKKNSGIKDSDIKNLIERYNKKIKFIIITERELPSFFGRYIYPGKSYEIFHFLAFAKMLISDSGTMATEAAILGVPNILINKLAKYIGVHNELRDWGLQYYFDSYDIAISTIDKLLENKSVNEEWIVKKDNYLRNCDDLNKVIIENIMGENHDEK